MSKYNLLWKHIKEKNEKEYVLTYADIEKMLGFSIDHSFLKYKNELAEYGYKVSKISMKKKKILFEKI